MISPEARVDRLPTIRSARLPGDELLDIDCELAVRFLTAFLKFECTRRRNVLKAVVGVSGGVDSAVVATLCSKAFGPENVFAFRMPYKWSSEDSLTDAKLVINQLGIHDRVIEITSMVDGYVQANEPDASPNRIGNLCARCRTTILFDQSAKLGALPIGTGNKTERMFGYFTWHADDAPPINPLGDLYKTQVWKLAEHLGVPEKVRSKIPTADLVKGQSDEGDFGIRYAKADQILSRMLAGFSEDAILRMGFTSEEIAIVRHRVASTHWKRHLPTVALLSSTAINEFYLRPVDY